MPHQLRPLDSNSGISEPQLHPHTGLRIGHYRQLITGHIDQLVSARPVPAAAAFTAVTVGNSRPSVPMTLTARVVQGAPAPATIRLRVKGRDQYGQPQIETTPQVSLVAKTNNYIYLSKVFSHVDSVEYISTVLGGGDTIDVGVWPEWDPVGATDATNEHLHQANLGIALYRWTRDHAQGVGSPASPKFSLYDPVTSFEVPKVTYYNISTAAGIGFFVPIIGQAAGADWEASTDKWYQPGPPAVTWLPTQFVEFSVYQRTPLIGFSR